MEPHYWRIVCACLLFGLLCLWGPPNFNLTEKTKRALKMVWSRQYCWYWYSGPDGLKAELKVWLASTCSGVSKVKVSNSNNSYILCLLYSCKIILIIMITCSTDVPVTVNSTLSIITLAVTAGSHLVFWFLLVRRFFCLHLKHRSSLKSTAMILSIFPM